MEKLLQLSKHSTILERNWTNMKYAVVRTDKFNDQLQDIIFYIKSAFSKEKAIEYLDFLENQINDLIEFPYLGVVPRYQSIAKQGYRALISKQNIIFYKVDDEIKTITLHIIVESSEDYINLI